MTISQCHCAVHNRHSVCLTIIVCRSYFSIDNYADDPASEVGGIKAAYAPVIPKLRKPNPLEPKGQGLVRL